MGDCPWKKLINENKINGSFRFSGKISSADGSDDIDHVKRKLYIDPMTFDLQKLDMFLKNS